ncbi:phage major tail tube protein [Kingella kingae]|uniref:phage major tail tube protein n=1 Tax=Kingella kingae TaxID=504 RepID=UPI0025518E35|nr:phage major tail tube protein [Kingella kingae]MDK4545463.1 phage major tail tube protein [Kingella kingae]MDK4567416.1 phage major tail tube protein [Kingella kingae]MDK4629201.1 phage major tail tube protein [Kingella kingae]MDK4637083.1 phage major tail tube protein [Kingella kingae]MDK4639100.1 phage major tail tube protein [Kingella kingae]
MKMPKQLKGFNLFTDGENQYGVIVDISRPKISRKTEDYTPGGAMGELTVAHGFEKLEMEITSKGYDADMLKTMTSAINGKLFRYQGALQEEDGTGYRILKGEGRGRIIEADPGTDKQGEGGEHKFKVALTYWKETLDGEEILELDFMQNKASFGGVDERKELCQALGLM